MFAYTENLKFAEFTLTPAKRTLFRERTEIKLRDKDFDVLSFLIESAPKTCSHDEIIESVWSGTNVENGSVEKAIANIRKILGDDARNPRFIKTIRSKGYLFIANVSEASSEQSNGYFPAPGYQNFEPQSFDKANKGFTEENKNYGFRYALLYAAILIIIAGGGIYLVKNFLFNYQNAASVIFSDDFSNAGIDRRI